MRFTKNTRILVVDTETANSSANMQDVLVYDCGWAVCDIYGNVYETGSYINRDIFIDEKYLMQTAYYASKISNYWDGLEDGKHELMGVYELRRALFSVIERHNIHFVAAYNARFDANALNRTISWISKSFLRYFFRFNQIEWLDIMKMAQDAVVNTRRYKTWATERGYLQKNGKPRRTAEMVFQYMNMDNGFKEAHTGLEDALIEVEILAYCFAERNRRKVKMRTRLWEKQIEYPERTEFQKAFMENLRQYPQLRMGAV